MDTNASFISILKTALYGTKARDAITEFCCDTLTELANLPPKDLDQAVNNLHKSLSNDPVAANRVRLNATKCITLHSIRLHFLDRINCDAKLTTRQISQLTADPDIKEFRSDYLDATLKDDDTRGLSEVKMPKLEAAKWIDFKSSLIESLSRIIGKNKIPLTYLIRESDVGNFDDDYENRTDRLVTCIQFSGVAYKHDNGDLYSILVQNTEGSEGYAIVEANEKRRNGRKAWKDLLNHFEGSTFRERMAQEAANMLRSATYNGPKRHFTLGDYYARHSKAHVKLQKVGKPMTVEQQIDTFIQGIQCATAQSIIVNVAGDPTVRTSFDTYYNVVASRLELALSLSGKQPNSVSRNVNQTKTSKNDKEHKNKRSSQTGQSKYAKKKNPIGNFTAEARRYSHEEWKALSADQQKQVKTLHRTNKLAQAGNTTGNTHQQPTTSGGSQQGLQMGQQMRCTNQVNSYNQSEQQPYYPVQYQQVPRYVNQVSLPPPPGSVIPPPPPRNQYDNQSTGYVSAMSGEAGRSWGGAYNGP